MPTLAVLDHAFLRAGPAVPAITRLGGGAVAMAGEGQPWRVVGLDAVVYQVRQPSGRVLALRCPLTDTFERSFPDRYRALAADPRLRPLRDHPTGPFPGDLTFLPDGLALPAAELRSVPHPVIVTDWVMGPTLIQAADRAARSGDRATLTALAEAWLALIETCAAFGFVHGDLSGDNALVRPGGGIALVDYDTAIWPGSPPPPAARGNPNYAHPTGQPAPPLERRDYFAALVIYVSLRILAERPELRPRFGDPTMEPGGALLFSPWDLVDPTNSPLFSALHGLEQPVAGLVRTLRNACIGRADAVPSLAEVVASIAAPPPATPVASERPSRANRRPAPAPAPRAHPTPPSREAVEPPAPGREQATWPRWESGSVDQGWGTPVRPTVEIARRRAAQIEQLREALDRGDMEAVARLWPEVRGIPLAAALAICVTDALRDVMERTIADALDRGDDVALLAAIRDAEEAAVPIDAVARRAGRAAAARIETRRRLQEAVARDDRATLTDLALSGRLAELGTIDRGAARAALRSLHWPLLEAALAIDDDHQILTAYEAEPDLFDDEGILSREQRARIDVARSRRVWLSEIRLALRNREVATVQMAMRAAPPGAIERLSEVERRRIERMTRMEDAVTRLMRVLKTGPDRAILEAIAAVKATGASLPDYLDWATLRGIEDRVSLAEAIREAVAAEPPDYARLAVLLPAARAAAREGGSDGAALADGLDFAALERDVLRAAHVARLRDAIATGDAATIAAAAVPDPYGAVAALPAELRKRVDEALRALA